MGEGKTIEHLERHRLRCLNQLNFVSAFLILFAVSEKKIAKSWKRRKRLEVRVEEQQRRRKNGNNQRLGTM
tara:strand:- start:37 stop:249 length:213 start_codon:yes stop_codon:yes gene_type:complete